MKNNSSKNIPLTLGGGLAVKLKLLLEIVGLKI